MGTPTDKPASSRSRRPKLHKERVEVICSLLEKGLSKEAACSRAGIDRTSLWRWMSDHAWVRDMVHAAEANLQEKMLDEVRAAAANVTESGARQWQAAAWLLERRFPESFRLRTEASLTGADGQPLLGNGPLGALIAPYATMTERELEREFDELLKVSGLRAPTARRRPGRAPRGG